jgi:hypothetical protein
LGEPVLRLVIPDSGDDRGQGPGWPATGQPPTADVAPGQRATNGATNTAASGATPAAAIPAAEPEPGATNGATSPAAGPAGAPAGDVALPELKPIGRPMTAGERAARLARHWLSLALEDVARPGEMLHAAWHGKPESLAQIHDYAVSRAWIPDGHEGSLAPALGAAYTHTVAKGGTALGLFICWVTARLLRLTIFTFVCGVLAVLIIAFG